MNTIFFWIAWGIISLWVLRTFYFSFSKQKIERLRKTAFSINLLILVFGFYPLISVIGVKNGFELFSIINALAIMFAVLLFVSTAFFLSTRNLNLKIASAANLINTFSYLGVMYMLRPGTFILTVSDILPIIAALLLLINNVVVLLLWQQLQLKEKKTKKLTGKSNKLSVVIFLIVTLVFGFFVYQKTQPPIDEGQRGVERVSQLHEVKEFKKAVEEGGRSKFNIDVGAEPTKDEPFYLIQVFEVFPDHRATFEWYRYYPDTGKVFRQFLERATDDNWDEVK